MESRVLQTKELHAKHFNCAQCVACTYSDLVGIDKELAFKAMEGHGSGMGAREGTCGAVTGACFLAGLKNSSGNMELVDTKVATQKITADITRAFMAKTGTQICKELKGMETGEPILTCDDCIMLAAQIVEDILFQDEKEIINNLE